jgi:hypothetical protein
VLALLPIAVESSFFFSGLVYNVTQRESMTSIFFTVSGLFKLETSFEWVLFITSTRNEERTIGDSVSTGVMD